MVLEFMQASVILIHPSHSLLADPREGLVGEMCDSTHERPGSEMHEI